MRKTILFATVLALMGSCSRETVPQGEEATGSLSVSVDGFLTKATTPNQGNEGTLNTVQFLLFNSSGELYRYRTLTTAEITALSVTIENIKTGSYTVALVANGPDLSSVAALTSLNAMTTLLGEYNVTSSGFLMTGTNIVTVTAGMTAAVGVELAHPVSRIVVSKITNALPAAYGSLTVNSIMLTNVCGTWKLMGGKPASATWYNREGRKDESPRVASHIIDGVTYTSSCPDLLWRSIGEDIANGASYTTNQYLYAFPNDAAAVPGGFAEPFSPQQTYVVMNATFGARTYWYPLPLSSFPESNTSYDVQLTVQGSGSDDPNRPVVPGTMTATVTVRDWTWTKTYSENI